jgi:FdhD protein
LGWQQDVNSHPSALEKNTSSQYPDNSRKLLVVISNLKNICYFPLLELTANSNSGDIMADEVEKFTVDSYSDSQCSTGAEQVAREAPVTIMFNNRELATLLCSPTDLNYLALGFLFSERLIENKDQVKKILVDAQRGTVRVETVEEIEPAGEILFKRLITSGCGSGTSLYRAADAAVDKVKSQLQVAAADIIQMSAAFQRHSHTYVRTHGIHSAALYLGREMQVFLEDVGRHNAVDKIIGKCLWEGIATQDRILMTTGRVSSEIMYKVAKAGIPVLISISSPTSLGVKIANELGITLVASARGKNFTVYANSQRLKAG